MPRIQIQYEKSKILFSCSNNLFLHEFIYRFEKTVYLMFFWHFFATESKALTASVGWCREKWIKSLLFSINFAVWQQFSSCHCAKLFLSCPFIFGAIRNTAHTDGFLEFQQSLFISIPTRYANPMINNQNRFCCLSRVNVKLVLG